MVGTYVKRIDILRPAVRTRWLGHRPATTLNAFARSPTGRNDAPKTNAFTERLAVNYRAELLLPVMFQKRNTLAEAMPEIDIRGGRRWLSV